MKHFTLSCVGACVVGAIFLGALSPCGAAADNELKACPTQTAQSEIRDAAGSDIDALQKAETVVQRLYGPAHSRKRVSDDEIRLIYRKASGALSISVARDGTGRIAVDCIDY